MEQPPTTTDLEGGYTPNTEPDRSQQVGRSVVGAGGRQRKAPQLFVDMVCPDCQRESTVDVYLGVASCAICPTHPFTVPYRLGAFVAR